MKRIITFFFMFVYIVGTIYAQQPIFHNTGKMHVGDNTSADKVTLYIDGSWVSTGDSVLVWQDGKTLLKGHFTNNVTKGNLFNEESKGVVEFNGNVLQQIHGTANKTSSHADFPSIRVNNSNAVLIAPEMGVGVKKLDLTKGRLILDSKIHNDTTFLVDLAHLYVSESVNYNRTPELATDKGVVQVKLALGDNYKKKRLVGFSPPFKRIYADYFTFNFLSKPSPVGLFGDNKELIKDLSFPLNAGEGFIVGQSLIDDENYYTDNLGAQWSDASYEKRATEQFSFARDFAEESFSKYITASDRFTGEELNIDDVRVRLKGAGYQYVGNPFTTPLDLSGLVVPDLNKNEWGVNNRKNTLTTKFWVISGGEGEGEYKDNKAKFTFTVSYLVGQSVGGTSSIEGGSDLHVAPMQLFVVGKLQDPESDIIIPASARVHNDTKFYRARAPRQSVTDEILIQMTDNSAGGFDRLCVVFRDGASLATGDAYDASKIFNKSGGIGQIYTKSSNNKLMTTNVISPNTESIDLYLDPAVELRNITFSAHRLQSLQSVSNVILEDLQIGLKTDLLANPEYSFISAPTDQPKRFVLHFKDVVSGFEDNQTNNVHIYSNKGKIIVGGLTSEDIGSSLYVMDALGRVVFTKTISNFPVEEFENILTPQVYVVKLVGKRSATQKLSVSKQ